MGDVVDGEGEHPIIASLFSAFFEALEADSSLPRALTQVLRQRYNDGTLDREGELVLLYEGLVNETG